MPHQRVADPRVVQQALLPAHRLYDLPPFLAHLWCLSNLSSLRCLRCLRHTLSPLCLLLLLLRGDQLLLLALHLRQLRHAPEAAHHAAHVPTALLQQQLHQLVAHAVLAASVRTVQHHDVALVRPRLAHQNVDALQVQQRVLRHVARLPQMRLAVLRRRARVQEEVVQTVCVVLGAAQQEGVDLQRRGHQTRRLQVRVQRLRRHRHVVVQQVVQAVHEARRRPLHELHAVVHQSRDDPLVAGAAAQLLVQRLADRVDGVTLARRVVRPALEDVGSVVVVEGQMRHQFHEVGGRVGQDARLVGDEVRQHGEDVDDRVSVEDVLVPDGEEQWLADIVGEEGHDPGKGVHRRGDVEALEIHRQL